MGDRMKMRVTLAVIALLVQAIGAAGVEAQRAGREGRLAPAELEIRQALDAADRRLAADTPLLRGSPGSDTATRLRSRSAAIRARLDALPDDPSMRMGALAGIRASISDLEYRTDLALLGATAGADASGAALDHSIEETAHWLDGIRRSATRAALLDHGASLDRIAAEIDRLRRQRSDSGAVAQPGVTDAQIRDLAGVRRDLRALRRELRAAGGPGL